MNNELMTIKTEYLPDLTANEIKDKSFRVLKSELPNLGLLQQCQGEGLYKCVFPTGVQGALAVAKDGSGNLGTIVGEGGIVGQARWVEQTFDPTMMLVAAALHNIEEKLDTIEKTQKEMFEYEHIKDEAKLYANAEFLTQTLRDYKNNVDNDLWLRSKVNQVVAIQVESKANLKQYQQLAENKIKVKDLMDKLIHTSDKAEDKIDKSIRYLSDYQKAAFLYAFSQYVHIILTQSYDPVYLENISKDIDKIASEYRDVFTDVSYQLEHYLKGAIDTKAVQALGHAAKDLGNVAKNVPLIKKTGLASNLKKAGNKLSVGVKEDQTDEIKRLALHQKADVYPFVESIENINKVNSLPLELYSDDKYIYINTGATLCA